MNVQIIAAKTDSDIEAARALLLEYEQSLGIDLEFQGFDREVRSLPGDYAPPRGRLLLALVGGAIAGCVAMRPLSAEHCEMKRLFIRPLHRGSGLGASLASRIIEVARSAGYTRMYLDTLPTMGDAQRLYERLGFSDVAPYRHNPIAGTRFLALEL